MRILNQRSFVFVALVFGELASHYPVAGALYQYSKFSVGPAYGWFVGWFYGFALLGVEVLHNQKAEGGGQKAVRGSAERLDFVCLPPSAFCLLFNQALHGFEHRRVCRAHHLEQRHLKIGGDGSRLREPR